MRKIAVFLIALVLWIPASFAEQAPPVSSVEQKLDHVIQTQTEILEKLDEIKSELEVVKVRATLR